MKHKVLTIEVDKVQFLEFQQRGGRIGYKDHAAAYLRVHHSDLGIVSFERVEAKRDECSFSTFLWVYEADCRPLTVGLKKRWSRSATRRKRAAALGGCL